MPVTNLPSIQQDMIRYGMSIYVVLGVIGNICNCIMFTRSTYRRTASSLYFIVFSISAILYVIWSTSPFFYALNYVDPQTQNIIYCKIRLFVGHSLGQYLRFCVVLASMDRFFATRTDVRIRALHSYGSAKILVIILIVICPLCAIHLPILMTIRKNVCSQFDSYKLIYAIYQLIVVGIVPPILMGTFSILTVVSLHRRHTGQRQARKRDRYLTRTVIIEVILNVIISIPYSINLVYGALTVSVLKSKQRLEIESFLSFLTTFSIYLISITPFYLFLFTSKSFRKRFLNLILPFWYKYIHRSTRIVPTTDHHHHIADIKPHAHEEYTF